MDDFLVNIKEFPVKNGLEVNDTDVLIIEDENNTCQITVQELRTALLGTDSVQGFIEFIKKDLQQRIEALEELYPFRIEDISLGTNNEVLITQEYNTNQDSISCSVTKKNIHEYHVLLKENEDSPGVAEYTINGIAGKWAAVFVRFSIDGWYVGYDPENSSGEWAENYSLDNNNPDSPYLYSAYNDAALTAGKTDRSLLLWVDMSDLQQTFAFRTEKGERLKIIFDFSLLPEKQEPELPSTYTIYQPEEDKDVSVSVQDNLGTRVFNITYNYDIPYVLKDDTNNIPQSGNWIKLKVTPPAGHALPANLTIDGKEITAAGFDGPLDTNGEERDAEDYDYAFIPHGETEDSDYYIDLLLRFVRNNQIHICVFNWSPDYLDTLVITAGKILYPEPPDTEEPEPDPEPVQPEPGPDTPESGGSVGGSDGVWDN